jgi:hypothetical protein
VITAQYPAVCREDCGHPIEPGDEIEHRGTAGGWRHVACPDSPDEQADVAALAQPRCTLCGLNHPGEC